VALEAATGKLKWYQQLVHHDLWDFDLPAAPTLIDVRRDGRTIPAVAVITKMTTLFIFDRVTGEPLFGMEERPVPQSTVPGEKSWPTQPFPLKPPPLGRTAFDPEKDFYTLTPEHEAYCRDLYARHGMYTHGIFTPPGLEGTMLTFPSTLGGGNWNGIAFDPTLGLAITNVMNIGQVGRMVQKDDPQTGKKTYGRTSPWGGVVGRFWNPEDKIPCSAPPFGELIAVNVNTGDIAWHVPFGYVAELKAKGITGTGALNMGGPILTASGLVFVGATTDGYFRAFETRTGRLLWETPLEASAHSIPMTFLGKDKRQYVVVAAGGGSFLNSPRGTKIVAFALPNGQPTLTASRRPAQVPEQAGAVELPEGPGRDATLKMCSGCHGLGTSISRRHTRREWQTVVENMAGIGAPGTRDDIARTVGYLSLRFGRVEVASATVTDLQEIAGLSPAEAAAIIEFRDHEGGIGSFEALKKVPGLDPGKLERLKDRFTF
jgi:quinoprotein glucose dehydrogenase